MGIARRKSMLSPLIEIDRRKEVDANSATELERLRHENAALRRANADLNREVEALGMYRRLTEIDPLTNLPNRRAVEARLGSELSRYRRTHDTVSVIVVDIDGFRTVNESMGHVAGDKLLQTLAAFLQRFVREYDVVGRLGADRFAIVLPEMGALNCMRFVQRLAAALAEALPGRISVGAATASADSVPETLLQDALTDLLGRRRVMAVATDEPLPIDAVPVDVVEATLDSVDTILKER